MDAGEPALDSPTLERLYTRLERSLYNVVYRFLWTPEDSHDVVQEAFVRLWQMRARVRIESVEPRIVHEKRITVPEWNQYLTANFIGRFTVDFAGRQALSCFRDLSVRRYKCDRLIRMPPAEAKIDRGVLR